MSSTLIDSSAFEELNKVMTIGTNGHSIGISKTMVAVVKDSTGDMRELYKLLDTWCSSTILSDYYLKYVKNNNTKLNL